METVDVKHQPGSQFEVDLNNSSLEPLLMVIATDIPQRYLTKLVDEPVSHKRLAYLTILLQELLRPCLGWLPPVNAHTHLICQPITEGPNVEEKKPKVRAAPKGLKTILQSQI